jgi:hypothetical protein
MTPRVLLLALQQAHVVLDNLPRKDIGDYISIVSTVILALVGFVTLLVVVYQSKETAKAAKAAADSVREMHKQAKILERQTEATEIAARAASDNIALLINKDRARVLVESVELKFMSNEQRNGPFPKPGDAIEWKVLCHGTSPAHILTARRAVVVRKWDGPQTEAGGLFPMSVSGLLRPDDKGVDQWVPIDSEVEEALETFNNPESRFRFALDFTSIIKYRDVFQKQGNWTAISRHTWMVTLDKETGGILSWSKYDHTDTEKEDPEPPTEHATGTERRNG